MRISDWSSYVCSSYLPIGADTLERQQRFQRTAALVEPAIGCRRLEHRVFTAHLISIRGHTKMFLDPPHHIKIRHPRLHHHHVGALIEIKRELATGFVRIGGINLVAVLFAPLAVSDRKRGVEGK